MFRLSNLNRGSVRLQKNVLMHGQGSNHSLSFNNLKWLCWNIGIALPVMNLVAVARPTVYLNKLVSGKFGFLGHAERKKRRKTTATKFDLLLYLQNSPSISKKRFMFCHLAETW